MLVPRADMFDNGRVHIRYLYISYDMASVLTCRLSGHGNYFTGDFLNPQQIFPLFRNIAQFIQLCGGLYALTRRTIT